MSRRSIVILGLNRQAKFLMLPLPYAMASIALAVLPFMWTKILWWPLTFVIWWAIARVYSLQNPNGPVVFTTVFEVTFTPFATPRKKGRTYANG